MADLKIDLEKNKKIYFASDFHLGLPAVSRSQEINRERKIIRWLDSIEKDAQAIFLVGDIFDFWFEYKQVVPKGYVRFLGKIAQLVDNGIPVFFFTGNHDLWMFRYLQEELGVKMFYNPIDLEIDNKKFLVGHGDGLGPGDALYKILKKIFTGRLPIWIFKWIHPEIAISLARKWSKSSRIKKKGSDEVFLGDKEFLIRYCKEKEGEKHRDYYIFGHRHLSIEVEISKQSRYVNLGEWVYKFTYGVYDGERLELTTFIEES